MLKQRRPIASFAAVLLLSAIPTAHGQAPQPAAPLPAAAQAAPDTQPKASTTLVVNTDEVSLNLVAFSKKKKLIADLKPSDIAVTDNGTPVTLHDLHLVTEKNGSPHLVTLVFDTMDGAAAANAQSIAGKLVKMLPPAGFQLSVLSLGTRLRLIQPFTASPDAVRRAIEIAKSESITLQRHFVAIPGEYLLEAAVLDRQSETAGAQRIRFNVPEPSSGPSLSDLVLVGHMDNFRADSDATEPLRFENGKVTPDLSGQVLPSSKTVSLFCILHPDAAEPPPSLEMQLLHDGSPAGHKTLPIHPGKTAGAIPYLASLDTSALSPGFYDIKTVMTQGT